MKVRSGKSKHPV